MSTENGVNPPAPNSAHNSNFSLLSVLGRERLTSPNYMDCLRNIRFTLRYENKEYVLDEQIPKINDDSTQEEIEAYQKHYDDANKVSCIMAYFMSPKLQKTFKNTWAYEMNQQLKEMFQEKVRKERLDIVKSLMACKPKPRASICAFVLEMKGYFDKLKSLNMVFDVELSINIILFGSCERGEGLLDLVHTHVCGPFRSAIKDGKRYYVTFSDDFSRYGYVYLIKHKSDTFEVFKRYQNEVEKQLGIKIKLTPPETPQLNRVAERRNRTLLDMVSKTPFEMWKGKRPSLGHIKIWGYEVYVRREAQDKLEARSEKCLFVGYLEESFGYLFYKPKDNVLFVARIGVFLIIEMISNEDSGKDKISDSTLSELDEPANYKEAMTSPKAAKWEEAMKSEIQYKTRLIAKGYTQTHEIDYEETFSLVAKIKSIRIMLAIATFHDYEIWQIDVNTAFLNAKLTEDVFMTQPEGFKNAKYPKRAYKLQKAIYGLKQASRDAAYILGIKIYKDSSKRLIGLSHDTYLDKILKRFKIENSKKGNLPLHHGIKISKDLCLKTDEELDKMSRVPYASTVGLIMYAMTYTRPNVSFALSMVSRHQQNPGEGYWIAKSSKQDTVADSTCESEYITACEVSNEAIWMKNFIRDLGVVPTVQDPIEIFCDNKSVVTLTKEPMIIKSQSILKENTILFEAKLKKDT
uniref:Uncharacterized protein n=1 Tax=Tanacetum cinerariifolium TaxID=118510 RepID=A0A6L2KMI4_TANCI|nr:hypothetical protein [Tanacetum cinerariifolium]